MMPLHVHRRPAWAAVLIVLVVQTACAASQTAPRTEVPGALGAVARPDYATLARRYADAMLDHGRPAGAGEGRAFSAMLDRQTLALPERPDERLDYWLVREQTGIRPTDRAWNASNPFHDAALYELLDALSADTGDAHYARAADDALAWHLGHAQHPVTGLVAWGEHLGWRLDTDRPTEHNYGLMPGDDPLYFNWGHLKHETEPFFSQWERAARANTAAFQRFADGYWTYQTYDHTTGATAHQTRFDRFAPDSGFVFPRTAGHGVYIWALAHQEATSAARRHELERRIAFIARAEASRRDPTSGAAPFLHPVNPPAYEAINDLAAAYDVARAAEIASLPDSLRSVLRAWAERSDRTILALDHDPAGAGFVGKADLQTLQPLSRYGEMWCRAYPGYTVASQALAFLARYEQGGGDHYRDLVLAAARHYLGSEPACATLALWPGSLGDAVSLELAAYDLTGDAAFLQDADRLGRIAVRLFLDDESGLPRVVAHPSYRHYEAITGGPDLMFTLYRLGRALGAERTGQTGRTETLHLGDDTYTVEWLTEDDFSDADWQNRWTAETGAQGKAPTRARVADGRLWVDDPEASEGVTLWSRQTAPHDVLVRFRIGLGAESPEGTFVVFAGAREADGTPLRVGARDGDYESYQGPNGISAVLASLTLDYARLRQLPAFEPALATNADVRSRRGQDAEVVVTVVGGRARTYVDGSQVYDGAVEVRPGDGYVALRNWHTQAWWDDVAIGEIVPARVR